MNDDELLDALGDALRPADRAVPADRLAAFRALAEARGDAPDADGPPPPPDPIPIASRRTILVGSIAAAVGAAMGAAATVAATGDGDGDDDEVAAVPTRPVDFSPIPEGVTLEASSIDHTWGMELLLDVSGLPVERSYAVSFATAEGPVSAGGFLSVDALMKCRFNATVLRDAVTEVTVVDEATGEIALRGRPA